MKRYMGLSTDSSQRIIYLNNINVAQKHLVNGGVYAIRTSTLKDYKAEKNSPQSWESETLPRFLINKKSLFAKAYSAEFIDIGIPDDYQKAQFFFEATNHPSKL
jgi:NDP-sugar pyrophosphorylase family protein